MRLPCPLRKSRHCVPGDPRIKERMDLDVDVARLKIMKADYKTKQFRLEDSLIRSFPAEIAKMKEQMESLKADMQTLSAHPHPDGGFAGMTVLTDNLWSGKMLVQP